MTTTDHREPTRARRQAALVGFIATCAAVAVVLLSVALHRGRQDAAAARADAVAARADAAAAGLRQQLGARAQADEGPNRTIPIPLAPLPPGFGAPQPDALERSNLGGLIKAKRIINDITYATIALGSADGVTKGMRFKVIDGNNFLGYLTVDSVERSESVGHVEGPAVASVRTGTEVRTQW